MLSATGSGGLDEFKGKLDPAKASFGFIRVKYANDEHSFREKFALVTWIGEGVKIMRRAKVSQTGRTGRLCPGCPKRVVRDPSPFC